MAFDIGLKTDNFGISYNNSPFYDFFYFGSFVDVMIFVAVFLIGFGVSYMGLKKFFIKKTKAGFDMETGELKRAGKKIENKNTLIIICLSLALLMTFGLLRSGWLFYYFGDIAGMIGIFLISTLFIIIVFGVFNYLDKAFGSAAAGGISGAMVWSGIWWIVNESEAFYNFYPTIKDSLVFLADPWSLPILMGLLFIIGKTMGKKAN